MAESISVFVDAAREAMPLRRLQVDEFRAEPDEFTPLLVWPDQETPPRP